jgi:uncharacterized protein YdhG (YjbR/CyaY superfamily)
MAGNILGIPTTQTDSQAGYMKYIPSKEEQGEELRCPSMPDCKPEVLYHFTSLAGLSAILCAEQIALTDSNLNSRENSGGVVWLTSSPAPTNHGLKFDNEIPAEHDKTRIRITLPHKNAFQRWDEWSDSMKMDAGYKGALVASAGAEETHKTWYISESIIPAKDILQIEDMMTGEIISAEDGVESLPEPLKAAHFRNAIDEYIANQPANLHVLLLNVRMAIKQALPDATEKISWQMPTFWLGSNLIHFAAQENHLGIYPGEEAMKHFAPHLIDYKTSKGAVQFPYQSFGAEQLNLIAEIAAWCGNAHRKRPS